MDDAGKAVLDLVSDLERERSAGHKQLKALVEAHGPHGALAAIAPRFAAGAPVTVTATDVLGDALHSYVDAERRLTLCASCPLEGGSCASDETSFRVGRVPAWGPSGVGSRACDRWKEFRTRRRLTASGVPAFYLDSTYADYDRKLPDDEMSKLYSFIEELRGRPFTLLLDGGRDTGKTRLAIATLRNIVGAVPRALLWYTDVTSLRTVMKKRYDEDVALGDPLENARIADVLVLDNVNPDPRDGWLHERVEGLLRDRLLDAAPTLLTTRDRPHLIESYQTISGFEKVATCSLR